MKPTDLLQTEKLATDQAGHFVQPSTGRTVTLHGINFASCSKLPSKPYQASYMRPDSCGFYAEADTVSFVNRPFPLDEAYEHLTRIKLCGYNTIRFIFTWEALEHEGPGIFDMDYVRYVIKLFKIIDEVGGLYVFLDPHQDAWSKFTGGSGAPLWTLYAAGLEPLNFAATAASKVHNVSKDPEEYTRMVWSTNYDRLATRTMFTLFFAGKLFAPNAVIEGKNIQDFLQDHFIESLAVLVEGLKKGAPEVFNTCLIGIETMNEPNKGFYGHPDLGKFPESQTLRLDETPTGIQAMRLGMGFKQELDRYELTVFGPRKTGTKVVDPKGVTAWIADTSMDEHYGFHRDPNWKLGQCLFCQYGVWDSTSGDLLRKDYFARDPATGKALTQDTFVNGPFVDYLRKFKNRLRQVDEDMFLIYEGPVLEVPPRIKGSDLVDKHTAYSIHYYDGMSLIFRRWNRLVNVDTLGVMRGKYSNPVLGLVMGEKNIRKSFRSQFQEMKAECEQNVGHIPVIMTETGMPFDMDDKKAYTDGNYSSQESACDALSFALDGSQMDFTWWCYNAENCHKWGDNWNLEDLSVFSKDDQHDEKLEFTTKSTTVNSKYSDWLASATSISSSTETTDADVTELAVLLSADSSKLAKLADGIRAIRAVVRPYPVLVDGSVVDSELDISKESYTLQVNTDSSTGKTATVVFLPEVHFPSGEFEVSVTAGTTRLLYGNCLQLLEWTYSGGVGKIELRVKSTAVKKKKRGASPPSSPFFDVWVVEVAGV